MDLVKLRKQLEIDEGIVNEIYNDHLGYPTFGIGHLITEDDPEEGLPVGTPVSEERIQQAFESDIEWVLADCNKLYDNFDSYPGEVQQIIANMMFNLGYPRLSKFKGMKAGVLNENWDAAADEMLDSRWARQVGARAERLADRMRIVGVPY